MTNRFDNAQGPAEDMVPSSTQDAVDGVPFGDALDAAQDAALNAAGASAGPSADRMRPSPARIVCDARRAEAALAALERHGAAPAAEGARATLAAAAGASPFLARLIEREAAWLGAAWARPAPLCISALAEEAAAAARDAETDAACAKRLRVARRRLALMTALGDLGGALDLEQVVGGLSAFAETAVAGVLDRLLRAEAERGRLPSLDPSRSGVFMLAMGKLGARELNYSSDIDLICLFDPDRLAPEDRMTAAERFPRIVRALVSTLSQITEEGYVARVDLRLRPDPASTSVCMSVEAALRYYESLGRTWERAAHIKARPIAGDLEAGAAYLTALSPFVWRRHLDFAAVEDAADMLARIRAHEGGADVAFAGHDIKLGAGGIREIEFLAQTRQVILGGRDPSLRAPRTRAALAALVAAGRLKADDAADLDGAYVYLRRLEHRLQMIDDRQTHRIPNDPEEIAAVAALMGADGSAALEAETLSVMRHVRRTAGPALDMPAAPQAEAARARVAAAASRFPSPERAAALAETWLDGRHRALRSDRAKARMRRLAPVLLERLSASGEPERAMAEFDRFLAGLPAGVQVLSLFEANAWLLDVVTQICALAPRLSAALARRPALFDAMLDDAFFAPPPAAGALAAELAGRLAREDDYERRLDAARRWAAERRFQIDLRLLRAETDAVSAQAAYSDVADASLRAMWPVVLAEVARSHGPAPGGGAAVLALGKLGSREMTATSDLDLIVVYDAAVAAVSDGPRPLAAPQYYARLAQALISALSAPTAEGVLYEVDMRLRPSGNAGPVATSLSAFERYQREDAWIWERMALTRARAVAGEDATREAVARAVAAALARPHEGAAARRAAAHMRARLDQANPQERDKLWALKLGRGALIDIEFIVQSGLLIAGLAGSGGVSAAQGLDRLEAAGALEAADAAALRDALRLQTALQQIERAALSARFEPETASQGLRDLFAAAHAALEAQSAPAPGAAAAAPSFARLETALAAAQERVRAAFDRLIGPAPAEA